MTAFGQKEMRSNMKEILVTRNNINKDTKDHQQAVKLARAWGKSKISGRSS